MELNISPNVYELQIGASFFSKTGAQGLTLLSSSSLKSQKRRCSTNKLLKITIFSTCGGPNE